MADILSRDKRKDQGTAPQFLQRAGGKARLALAAFAASILTWPCSPAGADPATAPAVAQRVVLREEDPSDLQGRDFVGSLVWRTEPFASASNLPPELAVRADIEIPGRHVTVILTLRRNIDQTLPASHIMQIIFNLPADFPFGGIRSVLGIMAKKSEHLRGAPLASLAMKVKPDFFRIELSSVEFDVRRNLGFLKERPWFDIPIVYNNGRRAILAIEKGTPGERAFEEAFKAWAQ